MYIEYQRRPRKPTVTLKKAGPGPASSKRRRSPSAKASSSATPTKTTNSTPKFSRPVRSVQPVFIPPPPLVEKDPEPAKIQQQTAQPKLGQQQQLPYQLQGIKHTDNGDLYRQLYSVIMDKSLNQEQKVLALSHIRGIINQLQMAQSLGHDQQQQQHQPVSMVTTQSSQGSVGPLSAREMPCLWPQNAQQSSKSRPRCAFYTYNWRWKSIFWYKYGKKSKFACRHLLKVGFRLSSTTP
eukprot:sb/3469162/